MSQYVADIIRKNNRLDFGDGPYVVEVKCYDEGSAAYWGVITNCETLDLAIKLRNSLRSDSDIEDMIAYRVRKESSNDVIG